MNLDSNDDDSDESDFISIAGDLDVEVNLNHYRVPKLSIYGPYGMNTPPKTRGYKEQVKFSNEGKIMTLTELAAQKVACHLPFGLVEHFDPPVPEPMQCRIAFWSFPQDEDDVKLYTCLANGNADYFYRAEELTNQNAVRDMLQVGFHLSANIQFLSENEDLESFKVALTFDRRRITSCSCTCMTSTFWCQHVVAVCLQRIRKPQEVKLRAPVSESLQRLEKNQLQKFAQYLINELPQQILPAAQKILDELLSGDEATINKNPAAPDPTAGATINEQTSWCLDYTHLSMDIHRILLKQCTAQPTVCSDIQSLHVTVPVVTAEYSQLLRPIRGREPEGIWNLISIVGEMMKRRDPNLFLLLDIMTEEVMKFDKIVTWWFETKVSLHSGSSIHFASTKNSQCTSQYSCSNFCDEIVHLWRLAALNPSANLTERQALLRKFFDWHLAILRKHSSITDCGYTPNVKASKRNLLEIFPGFKSAMEGCHIDWSDWDEKQSTLVRSSDFGKAGEADKPAKVSKRRKRKSKASKQNAAAAAVAAAAATAENEPQPSTSINEEPDQSNVNDVNASVVDDSTCHHSKSLANVDEENSTLKENQPNNVNENQQRQQQADRSTPDIVARREPLGDLNGIQVAQREADGEAEENQVDQVEDDLQVYFMDRQNASPQKDQKPERLEDLIKVNLRRLSDPLEILYAKVEGLHAHGYLEEARIMARRLASEILTQRNYPTLRQLYTLPRRRKKKGSLDNQMSIVSSETLSKVNFLSNVLIDELENHSLIFKLVLFGIELKRAPAATRPLEVRLISQKQELVTQLKSIVLREDELNILREKAESIRDVNGSDDSQPDALTSLILGNYIFEALVLTRYPRLPSDATLGFQCALSALGVKINFAEGDHPLLCEGIRRQRGELALALIMHHKDDQEKLDAILKRLLDKDLIDVPATCCNNDKSPTSSSSKKSATVQDTNHTIEAAAHFMFELAKTVFDKAGGNSTTVHLFRPQVVAQNGARGIHRKLHMCTLRIALYAVGLQNRTNNNWMHRTYNGRASFIHDQALEIGLPAIKYLCDNWQGYLTPVEAASIADKAGSSNDPENKRIAAEMAKSCLKYANYLDFNVVTRILAQCEGQTIEMIEEACSEVEQIADNEQICANVLFATARAWHGLYLKLITSERHCANENLYQLNNLISTEQQQQPTQQQQQQQQDTGAADWLANSNQSHLVERVQPVNPLNVLHMPTWDVYARADFILTPDTPIYKNIDYVRAAFRVGIKALHMLKLSPHVKTKHNLKMLDESLWLLGISRSLGRDCLYKFSQSIVETITDPYILHIIFIEIMKFFELIRLPGDHIDRDRVLVPIYDACLDRCMKQTRDLTKHTSNDQRTCIETILSVMQTLTDVTKNLTTAQYYWEILKFLDKADRRANRRSRFKIDTNVHRCWIKDLPWIKKMTPGVCDDCWAFLNANQRERFSALYKPN